MLHRLRASEQLAKSADWQVGSITQLIRVGHLQTRRKTISKASASRRSFLFLPSIKTPSFDNGAATTDQRLSELAPQFASYHTPDLLGIPNLYVACHFNVVVPRTARAASRYSSPAILRTFALPTNDSLASLFVYLFGVIFIKSL